MGFTTHFMDSFGHYDTAGIPLKWSTAGGAISTTQSRTNGQSLRIQSGDAPTIAPTGAQGSGGVGLAGSGPSIIGFAWYVDTLDDITILQLQEFSSGDIQITLKQASDGSLSLFNTTDDLIGQSPAATIAAGAWFYLELMVNLNPFGLLDVTQAVLTVTPDATHIAAQVINETGFTTSQLSFNALLWDGPASPKFGYVADFYNQSTWDGMGDVTAVVGAPKVYGQNVPMEDGLDYVLAGVIVTPPKSMAFDGTAAPWWDQVNELPQTTDAPIFETIGQDSESNFVWTTVAQGFLFDISQIPSGSTLAAIQATIMFGAASGTVRNTGEIPGCVVYRTGDPLPGVPAAQSSSQPWNLDDEVSPFVFYAFPFDTNLITGDPIALSDLSGPTALQFGPFVNAED